MFVARKKSNPTQDEGTFEDLSPSKAFIFFPLSDK